MKNKIESLSDGQKGLLCYARFMLQHPGLLILDEPTNHINFRHIPVIADAIDKFEGRHPRQPPAGVCEKDKGD